MELTTSQLIDGAADVLEVRGWRNDGRGWFPNLDPEGAVCVEGALRAAGNGRRNQAALDALSSHIGLPIKVYGLSANFVWSWNDWVAESAAEVIEVLRACAVIEQAREEQDAAWATYAGLVTA